MSPVEAETAAGPSMGDSQEGGRGRGYPEKPAGTWDECGAVLLYRRVSSVVCWLNDLGQDVSSHIWFSRVYNRGLALGVPCNSRPLTTLGAPTLAGLQLDWGRGARTLPLPPHN